jgi:ribonuclease T1
VVKWGLAFGLPLAMAGSLGLGPAAASAKTSAIQTEALAELSEHAQQTYRRVLAGGPFPYPKDGVVFGNREKLLPTRSRGWYREYTVTTPGASDRGPKRLVCGGKRPTAPEACWYTADHYASFSIIAP